MEALGNAGAGRYGAFFSIAGICWAVAAATGLLVGQYCPVWHDMLFMS
jgi:hypothetical protein